MADTLPSQLLPDDEIAAHEAGHAIVFLIFGQPFSAITIEESGSYSGAVIPDSAAAAAMRLRLKLGAIEHTLLDLIIWCAGPVAQSRQRGDEKITVPYLIADCNDPRLRDRVDDVGVIAGIARVLDQSIEYVTRQGATFANLILKRPSIWNAAEGIRDALLAQRTIPYAAACTIFDDVVDDADRAWAIDVFHQACGELVPVTLRQWSMHPGSST